MKKVLTTYLLLFFVILTWCTSNNGNIDSTFNTNNRNKVCKEPRNPYNQWWHYAGYEWAEEKWRACSWNSNSFIEWCEVYYKLQSNYNNCVNY